MDLSEQMRQRLLAYQKSEITEHHIYRRLAGTIRSPENRRVLEHIAGFSFLVGLLMRTLFGVEV